MYMEIRVKKYLVLPYNLLEELKNEKVERAYLIVGKHKQPSKIKVYSVGFDPQTYSVGICMKKVNDALEKGKYDFVVYIHNHTENKNIFGSKNDHKIFEEIKELAKKKNEKARVYGVVVTPSYISIFE